MLFKKMKLNSKDVKGIDTTGFGKVNVELYSNVDPEKLCASDSI